MTEDVAIASYLIVMWKAEREQKNLDKKQTFVDIGCGNGLLTHILSGEGVSFYFILFHFKFLQGLL